jgi:protein CpxP
MKKTIGLLLACLVAGVFSTQAQQGNRDMPRRTVEERVKTTLDKITPALNLNNDQVTQTDSAYAVYYRAVDKMRESMRQGGGRPDMSAFQKLNTERDEKLKKIFTEDQYKKFKDEVEPSMRPQRGNGQQPGLQQRGNNDHKMRKGKGAFKKVETK